MALPTTHSQEIEQAVKRALAEVMADPTFARDLAEEIADRLEGFDDKTMGTLTAEGESSPLVSEKNILDELKR